MDLEQLLPEIEQLEHMLASGPRPEPSPALRQQVLDSVWSELRCEHRMPKWRLAASVAAAVLVSLTLSLAVAQAAGVVLRQHRSLPSVHQVAKRIEKLSPDLSPEESLRQATLLQIAAEVGCRTKLGDRLGLGNAGAVSQMISE